MENLKPGSGCSPIALHIASANSIAQVPSRPPHTHLLLHQTPPSNANTSMTSVVQVWDDADVAPLLSCSSGDTPKFDIHTAPIPANLDAKIRRAALDSGIERPKGYNVSFHYNPEVEFHHFGRSHPMKPWRLQLTKQLVLSYGLQYAMDLYETKEATYDEMSEFHAEDYLDYLSR